MGMRRSGRGAKRKYEFGFHDEVKYKYESGKGLNRQVVEEISGQKGEPAWMREKRQKSWEYFNQGSMPSWGADLTGIDFNKITYYARPTDRAGKTWEEVPEIIKRTFERIGVPEAEKKYLAGVETQYDSEMIYGSIRKNLSEKGVIFLSMDEGLKQHPELVREYFGKLVGSNDNKFAALNSAVWSGGSFIYVPKGVKVELPLSAYFRINRAQMGQFERTLIIADEGSFVNYLEGCTAPIYSTDSLHAAVVEIFVKKGARVRYTTIQNWSTNVFNLVTKRARVEEEGIMEWVDGNLGSKVTAKYPSCYLVGRKARGNMLSLATAGPGQHQDVGGKMVHLAPETTSAIVSKSVSFGGGRSSYRGLVQVSPGATNVRVKVRCDALILDEMSRSDTYPTMKINEPEVSVEHEATVSRVGEEQLFYLMSRGVTKAEAEAMVVNGFIEPVVKELPMEYAVELNRLISMEMEGAVG
jgi:Fe-S cluster assembly protein SufB